MAKAFLYDRLGYVVGEPEVPDLFPKIVIWGTETFEIGCPNEDDRPQYYWADHFVIPETRESPVFH
jgi:hypothetical protein